MKTRNKKLVMALGVAALVMTSVLGTMAYLTSTDTVTNTFTVGQVKITLDEADVKTDGTYETTEDNRVEENAYHLLPGHTYIKDPTVHVDEDSEESYLFIKLEIQDNADLKTALGKYGLSDDVWDLLTGSDKIVWKGLDFEEKENGTRIYYLAYNPTVKAGDDITLFDSITVPGQFTNEDMKSIKDLKINVTAYAVQKDGFANAEAAWAATFANDVSE